MMGDLLIGVGMIGAGVTGLFGLRHMKRTVFPAINAVRAELAGMTHSELRTDLARCMGAILVCGSKGDRRGVRHARLRVRLVSEALLNAKDRPQQTLRTAR